MGEMSLWHLLADAGWIVRAVMLLLLAISIASWAIIMERLVYYRRVQKLADEFEGVFWSGCKMSAIYSEVDSKNEDFVGLESIFHAGFKEFMHLRSKPGWRDGPVFLGIERRMKAAAMREQSKLESQLAMLATIGSTSPYIGLFGTVWGIMTSFSALSVANQASMALVAPGISEALIATAMGLFAAIPAVITYNYFANQVDRLLTDFAAFQEDFMAIITRQSQKKER